MPDHPQLTIEGREERSSVPVAPVSVPAAPARLFAAPQTIRGQLAIPAEKEEPDAAFTASDTRKPEYPCDICGHDVVAGERVSVTDNGLTVEHTACVTGWVRRNYGREGLS